MAEEFTGAMDRGLEGVVVCQTGISSIVDATLCFRGYTIEDLAENSSFEEVTYLLWNDRLPNASELDVFQKDLRARMPLSEAQIQQLQALPTDHVHPMAWLRTAVSMLALWDPQGESDSPEARYEVALQLTAKLPSLVALFERTRQSQNYVAPRSDRSLAWNFLYMLKGEEPGEEFVKVFDTCLILHADHELNCSAFASRVTASSLSDVYSAVVSAVGALKGPLHGGANEQVMKMLKEIGTPETAPSWVSEALAQKKKIMGFGHRVYKNGDPRAKILKGMSKSLAEKAGTENWYQISQIIDDTVVSDKGLLPNVDFYSATVYNSMGIPHDVYTPIFAMSRVTGWLAHIFEQYANNRIYRPRGKWVGKEGKKYTSVSQRS